MTTTAPIHVTVDNPDDPHGMPSFDGDAADAYRTLTVGEYPCMIGDDPDTATAGTLIVSTMEESWADGTRGPGPWDGGLPLANPTTEVVIYDPWDEFHVAYRGPIENAGMALPPGRWLGVWRVTSPGPSHAMIGATYLVTVNSDGTSDGVRVS